MFFENLGWRRKKGNTVWVKGDKSHTCLSPLKGRTQTEKSADKAIHLVGCEVFLVPQLIYNGKTCHLNFFVVIELNLPL